MPEIKSHISRLDTAQERINELRRAPEIAQCETQAKRRGCVANGRGVQHSSPRCDVVPVYSNWSPRRCSRTGKEHIFDEMILAEKFLEFP